MIQIKLKLCPKFFIWVIVVNSDQFCVGSVQNLNVYISSFISYKSLNKRKNFLISYYNAVL
jgi:hypothetical protein